MSFRCFFFGSERVSVILDGSDTNFNSVLMRSLCVFGILFRTFFTILKRKFTISIDFPRLHHSNSSPAISVPRIIGDPLVGGFYSGY